MLSLSMASQAMLLAPGSGKMAGSGSRTSCHMMFPESTFSLTDTMPEFSLAQVLSATINVLETFWNIFWKIVGKKSDNVCPGRPHRIAIAHCAQDKERKIIFICHDLGGVIVKKVLLGFLAPYFALLAFLTF